MARLLKVPKELEQLLEKRELEDRRGKERRATGRRRSVDLGPLGSIESAKGLDEVATEERRSKSDRRISKVRRTTARRASDVNKSRKKK